MRNGAGRTWVRRLWNRVRLGLVQDVPERLSVCEFMCLRPQCRVSDWETCELRRAFENGGSAEKVRDVPVRERILLVSVGRRSPERQAVNE